MSILGGILSRKALRFRKLFSTLITTLVIAALLASPLSLVENQTFAANKKSAKSSKKKSKSKSKSKTSQKKKSSFKKSKSKKSSNKNKSKKDKKEKSKDWKVKKRTPFKAKKLYAKISLRTPKKHRKNYKWKSIKVPVTTRSVGEETFVEVKLTLQSLKKTFKPVVQVREDYPEGKASKKGNETTFKVKLTKNETPIDVIFVDPRGEVITIDDVVVFNDWIQIARQKPKSSSAALSVELGPTLMQYQESPAGISLTQMSLTAKVAGSMPVFSELFDIGFSVFGNVFSFYRSPSDIPEARVIGINVRGGIRLPFSSETFWMKILAGYYFWTMIVENDAYGIKTLAGGQAYVSGGSGPFWGYLKIVPLASDSLLSIENREIGFGGGYRFMALSFGTLTASANVSMIQFSSSTQGNSMKMNTYSLGLSLGL